MRTIVFLLIIACGGSTISYAQTVSLQSYDLNEYKLSEPILAGVAGNRIFVTGRPQGGQTPLFIFDSTPQLIKKIFLPEGAYLAKIFAMDNAIRFTWFPIADNGSDSASIVMSQVSPDGVVTSPGIINVTERPGVTPALINDLHNKYQLLYAFEAADNNKVFFRGVLLDTAGRSVKQLAYSIDVDQALNQAPYVTVDTHGNIHILVVDRLTNYRLSSTVTINTIPFAEETISSESFNFERVKFNLLALTDDPSSNTVRLQGFYYDATQKNTKKGLASLSFAYERGKPLETPRFIPFTDDLRAQLRKNMPHLRKKDDPFNSFRLKEVLVNDGQTVFTYFLHDISEVDLTSDFDLDIKRAEISQSNVPGFQAPSLQERLNRWLNDAERLNKSMLYNPSNVSVYFIPEQVPQRYPVFTETPSFTPVVGNGIQSEDRQRAFDRLDRDSRTNYERTGKLVSFRFKSSGEPDRYSILEPSFLYPPGGDRLGMITHPLLYEGELYYTAGTALIDEKSQFSLVHPNGDKNPDVLLFPFPFPPNSFISRPIQAGRGKYAALVKEKGSSSFGLLLYTIRR